METVLLKDEVYAVIGAAIEVHRELGHGFLEPVYQEAFESEMTERQVPYRAQTVLRIRYKEHELQHTYVADLVCDDQIIVELKALEQLTSREEAQLLNYLKATGIRAGLLINFGSRCRLEWKRLVV